MFDTHGLVSSVWRTVGMTYNLRMQVTVDAQREPTQLRRMDRNMAKNGGTPGSGGTIAEYVAGTNVTEDVQIVLDGEDVVVSLDQDLASVELADQRKESSVDRHVTKVIHLIAGFHSLVPVGDHALVHLLDGLEAAQRFAFSGGEVKHIGMTEVSVAKYEGSWSHN